MRLTRLWSTLGKCSDAELRLQSASLVRLLNEEFAQGRAALEFQPLQLTDEAMDKLAKTIGCPVQAMTFEPYPS